jgi:hypothetical protein
MICPCCHVETPAEKLCPLCMEQYRKSAAYARAELRLVDHDSAMTQFAEAGLCRHGGEE